MPQPTGSGSANPNAYQNVATSIFGDNQPTEHIDGGNIPAGTADSGGAAPIYAANQGINYPPVVPPGSGSSGGNGWSNTTVNYGAFGRRRFQRTVELDAHAPCRR